jgi:hypothetical protein
MKGDAMAGQELERLIDQEMAEFDENTVQWETAVPETGDQIVFDTIGDVFTGLYLGSRTVLAEEDNPESAFRILMFTGTDGKPYQVNAGWKLESAFKLIPERSIVRITYVKDIDTGQPSGMKDYRVEVARRP